jgi:hypothetical protein
MEMNVPDVIRSNHLLRYTRVELEVKAHMQIKLGSHL